MVTQTIWLESDDNTIKNITPHLEIFYKGHKLTGVRGIEILKTVGAEIVLPEPLLTDYKKAMGFK